MSGRAKSGRAKSGRAKSGRAKSGRAKPGLARPRDGDLHVTIKAEPPGHPVAPYRLFISNARGLGGE